MLSASREKDKSSSFSALFTCYSFLFQALQQTAMKLLDIINKNQVSCPLIQIREARVCVEKEESCKETLK